MTLNQLRAFVMSVRLGSFTAAAAELSMAQASISELVRRLEEEFGLRLLTRGARRLSLTDAGEKLLPYAEQALAAVESASEELTSIRGLDSGTVNFGLLRNWPYYGLADLPKAFADEFPNIGQRLVALSSSQVAERVARGDLEAGIVVLPVEDDGLLVTPLVRDELVFATSDPNRAEEPVTMAQLASARLTMYDAYAPWTAPTRKRLAEEAQLEGYKLTPNIEVEHVEAALGLVAQGTGETVLPKTIALSKACPDGIHIAPFERPIYDVLAFIQRPSAALSPGARVFSERACRALLEHTEPENRLRPL